MVYRCNDVCVLYCSLIFFLKNFTQCLSKKPKRKKAIQETFKTFFRADEEKIKQKVVEFWSEVNCFSAEICTGEILSSFGPIKFSVI